MRAILKILGGGGGERLGRRGKKKKKKKRQNAGSVFEPAPCKASPENL